MTGAFLEQGSFVQGGLVFGFVGLFAVVMILVIGRASRVAGHVLGGVSASLMSPLGALFGLTAAFLGSSVWQNHGDAIVAANLEARSLAEAAISADRLPEPTRTAVEQGISRYIHTVITEEWPRMTSIVSVDNPISLNARNDLLVPIRELFAYDGPPSAAVTATQQFLRIAFEARSRRIDIALHRISSVQLLSTLVLGLLLITLVGVVHHGSVPARVVGVSLAAAAVGVAIAAIVMHDNPFSGYLAFTAEDFAKIATYGLGG
jgi:hypothetical protein